MFRRLFFGIAAIVAMLFVVAPASAQQRIALVIGNAAYPKGPIATSLADGGLVAEALTSVGFEIVEGADVNSGDMRKLFGEFLARVNAAGPDTIAFIYYNGYAVQFEGDNYLIPVDAQLNRDSEIPIQGIRLFDLLRPLADAPATTKIVVLDAARALPFQIQGGQLAPGLGAIESAPGMLVAFASAPGTLAPEGPGPYGAYATAIAEMVREPGLDIDTMFARIRLRTNETTQGAQTPWDVSQLQQVAILVPGQPAAPPPGAQGFLAAPQTQIGAPVVRRRPPPRPIRDIGPEEAYGYTIEVDDLPTYVEYVRTYPNSQYTPRVWAMIRARREALVWRDALLRNSPDAYWTYLERYPDGLYVYDARRRLRRLSAGDRPPSGWRMMDFADVPPPLAGEPARIITVLPPAPPPRFMRPPPAFIVGLPPPPRQGGGGGLWRRDQPAFPVIVAPQGGGRPGAPGGRPGGPGIANQPPAGQPGGPPPGGPPGAWQKPGTGAGNAPPAGPPGQKGPAVVTTPPAGAGAPPGATRPGFQPPPGQKGPAVVTTPPAGAGAPPVGTKPGFQAPPGQQKPPAVVTTPPPTAPRGGPPNGAKGFQNPASGAGNAPPAGQPKTAPTGSPAFAPKAPAVVNQPPAGGPPAGAKGPPGAFQKSGGGSPPLQQTQQPKQPQVAVPPPPKAPVPPPPPPPPQVKAPPPQPFSPPPGAGAGAKGPSPGAGAKGPPPGAAKGLPKCAVTGGKQPCQP